MLLPLTDLEYDIVKNRSFHPFFRRFGIPTKNYLPYNQIILYGLKLILLKLSRALEALWFNLSNF